MPTDVDPLLTGWVNATTSPSPAGDGVFPLVASAEGKNAVARALLSTAAGSTPEATFAPPELIGHLGTVDSDTATPDVDLGRAKADTTLSATSSERMAKYDWTINGHPYADTQPLTITQGQRATLSFTNTTMRWHPTHLHGHTFRVLTPDGRLGPRKDTVIVLPMQTEAVDLVADNSGSVWMLHCHNTYHQEAGMMTSLNYTAEKTPTGDFTVVPA